MPLSRLTINQLRNLKSVDLSLHPSLNLFYGDNGAGKTSLLEAINLLSVGRSFRHHRPKPLINYDSDKFVVHGETIDGDSKQVGHRLGVSKSRQGDTEIRVDGQAVYSAASLAESLPVLNINALSFELIGGPPKPRRQLLDWLTFHVEPSFLEAWKRFQYCLKQRNSLLRRGNIRGSELSSWDTQLAELSEKIDGFRGRAFNLFEQAIEGLGAMLPDLGELTLAYKRGWSSDSGYRDLLAQQLESDSHRGFTQVGPHRADLVIKINGVNAAEVLSRGQQKVVISAVIVALGIAYRQKANKSCIYLIDDLPSELDETHRQRVGHWLRGVGAQLFVTAVDKEPLCTMWPEEFVSKSSLFHVKHGEVSLEAQESLTYE